MEEEHGPAALDLMRRVKASFDPRNLFNPGKVFFASGGGAIGGAGALP
jgi:FAD/FMN-containing dehydrogenase